MYLLYNTNFLVQRIKNYNTLEDSLRELQIDTISRTLDYNDKIYVIQENEQNIIYTSDGEHIYLINLTDGKKTNIFTNKKIKLFSSINPSINLEYSGVLFIITKSSISKLSISHFKFSCKYC